MTATTKLAEHKSDFHKTAMALACSFKLVIEGKVKPIQESTNTALSERIQANRQKLSSNFKTVIICGRQNLALCGHRDDSNASEHGNKGNFQALLEFRAEAGGVTLKEHLMYAKRNATYTSKTIQNEIFNIISDHITSSIVQEISVNRVFAVLADEAIDSNHKEQLPLVIRFLEKDINIREDFLGFYECAEGISGEAVSNLVLDAVRKLGLRMEDCRGQCYDGAGNMAGKCKGAASRIIRQFPLAMYVHCNSHQLNLCVVKACNLQSVRNMMNIL